MRDRNMYGASQPGRRYGGRNERWQEGREDAANAEFGAQGRGRRHDRFDSGRDRARRGDARYVLLDALRDGPKHGYDIIKALEERSAGRYIPSPGTVYPTLQYLEEQGLVRAKEEVERRMYQLTEAGQAELDAQATQVTAFWERFAGQGVATATQHEVGFLQDELEHLNHIVWSGLRPAMARGQNDAIRRVRSAIEECQNTVREIIATGQAA